METVKELFKKHKEIIFYIPPKISTIFKDSNYSIILYRKVIFLKLVIFTKIIAM